MKTFHFNSLSKPVYDSRIQTDEVTNKERWLGYFLGPAFVATVNAAVGGSYLNSFYTDVLHMNAIAGGVFLAMMPVISKILDAITNIIMGQFVDCTKSKQGKARPWILLSGPLMLLSVLLLFAVPASNQAVQAAWVVCSYNLFFSISYTMYNLSNVVMIPVSTRDNKKRDTLAMAASMGREMVPGLILAVIFPSFILPYMGVDQGRWMRVMSVISILAILGTTIQYYFTKERITEEVKDEKLAESETIPLKLQIKGCLSSKYWVMAMVVITLYAVFTTAVSSNSILYYANWVVGTYNDGKTLSLLNIIGQALLGPGILLIWPLVKKIGKQKLFIVCGVIAAIGGAFGTFFAKDLMMALVALTIRSIGLLPYTYVLMSVVADALDHVEWKTGYRCDGFSSSVYSIILTVSAGIGMGIINLGLSSNGYVAPLADGTWVEQSQAVKDFLVFATFGLPAIASLISTIVFCKFNLEKQLPQIHKELADRRSSK